VDKIIRAACGTDCKKCPAFIARITNDDNLRSKTALEWNKVYNANFTADDINCVGCVENGIHSGYCSACPIRACVISKNIPYCCSCEEFKSCATRKSFEEQGGIKMESFF
jgi:hypothetical protein